MVVVESLPRKLVNISEKQYEARICVKKKKKAPPPPPPPKTNMFGRKLFYCVCASAEARDFGVDGRVSRGFS